MMVCYVWYILSLLAEGDIVNIDVTSILDGWFADANRTFLVGKTNPEAERLRGSPAPLAGGPKKRVLSLPCLP